MMNKIGLITDFLKEYYEKRIGSIHHEDPFQVLIRCVLSQRTREENTEVASKKLFKVAKTPNKILKLSNRNLEKLIKSSGFYRQKTKRIKQICKILLRDYKGKVPKTREELLKLPGVGWKTSAIVLSYGYGIPIIAVDTHVFRISKRLGLANEDDDVEEVRERLQNTFPKNKWYLVNLGFVNFGREICLPRFPKCNVCPLLKFCPYGKNYGIKRFRD
jgi:endonuclease-3